MNELSLNRDKKIVHFYILSKYLSLGILFLNSLIISNLLSPHNFGIWAFISLIIQFSTQINLGIPYSLNATMSVSMRNPIVDQKIVGSAITLTLTLSLFYLIFFLSNTYFDFGFGSKYNFEKYTILIVLIVITSHFNLLLINIYRTYVMLFEISVNQLIYPLLCFILLIIYKSSISVEFLLYSYLVSVFLSFIYYIVKSPVELGCNYELKFLQILLTRGYKLFVFNSSFYVILILTRSFVSLFYSVKEFGSFSFSFICANAILLVFESVGFVIYPKILKIFFIINNVKSFNLIKKIRNNYLTSVHLLIHISILVFPIVRILFPRYSDSVSTFRLTVLTLAIQTNSFGFTNFLTAKGKEGYLSIISISALIFNSILVYFFVVVFKLKFQYIICATLITYIAFSFTLGIYVKKMIFNKYDFNTLFIEVFPVKLAFPYLVTLTFIVLNINDFYFFISTILFIFLNRIVIHENISKFKNKFRLIRYILFLKDTK